jgi:hypothetical protein
MKKEEIVAQLKNYPLAVGLVVLAILMGGLGYYLESSLDDAKNNSKELEDKADVVQRNLAAGHDLEANRIQVQADLKALDAALLDPTEVIENQQYFWNLEGSSGIKLFAPNQGLTVSLGKNKDDMTSTPFTIGASGSWDTVTKYLYQLESGTHLVRVHQFRLSKDEQQGKLGQPNQLAVALEVEVLGK